MALSEQRQLEARRRLSAQRTRAGFLRGRVIAASILCFGVLWSVVFVQMATGNDPVLSAKSQPSAAVSEAKRRGSPAIRSAAEAIETTEPRELEDESESRPTETEPEAFEEPEPEVIEEAEPEVFEEPGVEVVEEPELEALTTGQS